MPAGASRSAARHPRLGRGHGDAGAGAEHALRHRHGRARLQPHGRRQDRARPTTTPTRGSPATRRGSRRPCGSAIRAARSRCSTCTGSPCPARRSRRRSGISFMETAIGNRPRCSVRPALTRAGVDVVARPVSSTRGLRRYGDHDDDRATTTTGATTTAPGATTAVTHEAGRDDDAARDDHRAASNDCGHPAADRHDPDDPGALGPVTVGRTAVVVGRWSRRRGRKRGSGRCRW